MFAAIDLGSNSFRLHIGMYDGSAIRILKSARDPIRLAAGLDAKGNLSEAAMQSAIDSLKRFRNLLGTYELDAVRVVATNTLRIARNAPQLLPAAEQAIGYPIEIISGEEEARLIYIGVANSLAQPAERRLVLDIGGGSTELILGHGQDIERVESFSIGTVKQCTTFFPGGELSAAAFDAAILSARSHFEDAALPFHPKHWSIAYGSSGTIRALADAIGKIELGDLTLSLKNLLLLKTHLLQFGHIERIDISGMKPDRSPVMVGGLAILIALMQELGIKSMQPIEAGLRVGVLWDLQLRATKRDRREQSVHGLLQRFHVDEVRATKVAQHAIELFSQLKPVTGTYDRQLYWSGLLHELGLAVSQSGYHKHGAYLIENADLPGFTTREQRSMGMLVLGQKGNLRKLNGALDDADFAKALLALRLAVMFLHSHIDAAPSGLRVKMKHKIEIEFSSEWIALHPTLSYWIGKEKEWWDDVGSEFTIKLS